MIPDILSILDDLREQKITVAEALRLINRHIELAEERLADSDMRDHFAAMALPAVIGTPAWHDLGFKPVNGLSLHDNTALCAYQVADAMLRARAMPTTKGEA